MSPGAAARLRPINNLKTSKAPAQFEMSLDRNENSIINPVQGTAYAKSTKLQLVYWWRRCLLLLLAPTSEQEVELFSPHTVGRRVFAKEFLVIIE